MKARSIVYEPKNRLFTEYHGLTSNITIIPHQWEIMTYHVVNQYDLRSLRLPGEAERALVRTELILAAGLDLAGGGAAAMAFVVSK